MDITRITVVVLKLFAALPISERVKNKSIIQ